MDIVEDELLTLAEDLKPDIQQRMKIEMAPWVKGYTVDMDKLYTELTLEKIENEPSGPENTKFTDFKLLFEDKLISSVNEAAQSFNDGAKRRRLHGKSRRKKVLIKGDLAKAKLH